MISRAIAAALVFVACSERPSIPADLRPEDLVLAPHPERPEPVLPNGVRVRVATFNIHGGDDATPEAIGAFLASQQLDLVGLQECSPENATRIAAAAGFEHVAGDGQAILARHPLRDFEKVALETRSFVHATTAIGGVDFSVYIAHVGWNAEGDRQCRLFIDEHVARDPNPYLIAAGDFNDEHFSSQNDILETVLADAFTTAEIYPGDKISWPATTFDGSEGSQLIDLVFFRKDLGVIVREAEVFNLAPVLSDHKPVIADLLFPSDPAQPFSEDPYAAARDEAPEFVETTNLLQNPGAEDDLSGWTVAGSALAEERRGEQSPKSGARMFAGPRAISVDDPATSSGSQLVDLQQHSATIDAGRGILSVAAETASAFPVDIEGDIVSNRPRPYDDGEFVVDIFDAGGERLLEYVSGRRDLLAWHRRRATIALPPGARSARYSWIAHRKIASGDGSDALFDELFLGFSARETVTPLSGGDLVKNGGAEELALAPWEGSEWFVLRDQESLGLMLYPPWTHSGAACFVLGAPIDGPHDLTRSGALGQKLELARYAEEIDAGGLALRWGARVRTYSATSQIHLALELFDRDGSRWGRVEAAPIAAAEWTEVESLTRLPPGATAARLVIEATVAPAEWAFADAIFALPERVVQR